MDLGNGSVGVLRVQGYWMVWDARQQKKTLSLQKSEAEMSQRLVGTFW